MPHYVWIRETPDGGSGFDVEHITEQEYEAALAAHVAEHGPDGPNCPVRREVHYDTEGLAQLDLPAAHSREFEHPDEAKARGE